jgi:hypothetical protein
MRELNLHLERAVLHALENDGRRRRRPLTDRQNHVPRHLARLEQLQQQALPDRRRAKDHNLAPVDIA